ncbi:helix-turn-helix domain-containing protein [Nonomuraea lactucae]|uniref:AraC-like ligand-binding domain-containing protein n=1 Tax=Nonomuraea lactucae TaxID=2249762 RepID=UPI0013B44987|nr:helix-turn-helix domain-containing protein [Nonomuraea lactucae]
MSAVLDRRAYAELATSAVPAREAFAYWREMICATFVRLTAEPVTDGRFRGRIEHIPVGDLELSAVVAGSQHVRRTRSLIAQGNEEYLLASIQLQGSGRLEQDALTATLSPGDMAFYDSTRPYTLHFDDPFHQLVVQVPKRELMLGDTRRMTARVLGRGTPGGVVATFFTSLFDVAREDPQQSAVLLPHAIGLLSAAASFGCRTEPTPDATHALARERVLDFLRRNLADPRLDAATVAKACNVSRRTLYRMFGDEGVAARLRRMRIEHAKAMLLHHPERPVGAVGLACGFDSESGFHRAFRAAAGKTPGEYRQARHAR